ncbi:hypothetical protein KAW48_09210, partial [candidate division WOR-3 bacterium]|nr:hypothetical protein [candidate division WOR-3 bacterium]
MRKTVIILSLFSYALLSQNLQPPVSGLIVSDYGPRNWNGYDCHEGIDYDGNIWDEIEAVEGGQINEIAYQRGGAGWYIRIQGTSGQWTYMHTFYDDANNNPISPDSSYEAIQATLISPGNPQDTSSQYIFIFWVNRNSAQANKVLSSVGNKWIRWGADYIRDENGDTLLTQGNVANREVFAPLGTSGGVGSHVHVGLNTPNRRYDINPLYHIIHPQPNYTLSILHPQANAILYHHPGAPEGQQLNERIKVNVNSATGLDLDRTFIYFFKPGEPHSFDDAHRYAKVIYGGLPPGVDFANPFPQRITYDGNANRGSLIQSGVDPQGDDPGSDDFYFIGGFSQGVFQFNTKINQQGTGDARINSEAKFKDGRKDMVIRAHSIRYNNGDYYVDIIRQILLDNFVPFVSQVIVEREGEVVYNGNWELSGNGMQLNVPTEDSVSRGDDIHLKISFSEFM